MSQNMQLWQSLFVTDPAQVKPITGKQYRGNSPKPYWIIQRLTETFGPCGDGWGLEIVNERMERMTETDVLHIAHVRLWYINAETGKRCDIVQLGQTKACYKTSAGAMLVDEDAPKKSVTDALTKCASYLGLAGDIFSGRWDDSGYVAEANAHYHGTEATPAPQSAPAQRQMPAPAPQARQNAPEQRQTASHARAPQRQAADEGAGSSDWPEIVVETVTEKTGEGANGPWTKFGVKGSDGKWYSTFDTKIGELAKSLKGQKAFISYRQNAKNAAFNDLLEIRPCAAPIGEDLDIPVESIPF